MHFRVDTLSAGLKVAQMKTKYQIKRMLEPQGTTFGIYRNGKLFEYGFLTEKAAEEWLAIKTSYEFTPEELQRMDDDRSERECYNIEDAREDNSNPPEVQ